MTITSTREGVTIQLSPYEAREFIADKAVRKALGRQVQTAIYDRSARRTRRGVKA